MGMIVIVPLAVAGLLQGVPIEVLPQGDPGHASTLAACLYQDAKATRQLSLIGGDLEPFSTVDRAMYAVRHPDGPGLPISSFFVVESEPSSSPAGRVLSVFYGYGARAAFPVPTWSGAVVRDPHTARAYVVFARAHLGAVHVSAYGIDSGTVVGAYPMSLHASELDSWPKSPDPIAEVEIGLGPTYCGVQIASAMIAGSEVFMYAQRDVSTCPRDLYLRLDLTTRRWAEWNPDGKKEGQSRKR